VRRSEKKALNAGHKGLKMYKLYGPLSKAWVQEPWEQALVLLQSYINEVEIEVIIIKINFSTAILRFVLAGYSNVSRLAAAAMIGQLDCVELEVYSSS
jgi:hypothetical protein